MDSECSITLCFTKKQNITKKQTTKANKNLCQLNYEASLIVRLIPVWDVKIWKRNQTIPKQQNQTWVLELMKKQEMIFPSVGIKEQLPPTPHHLSG